MMKPRQNRLSSVPTSPVPTSPVPTSPVPTLPVAPESGSRPASTNAKEVTSLRPAPTATAAYFYSSATDGELSQMLGAPHYSYRFAEQKFLRAFAGRGISLNQLQMPEYYSTVASLIDATGEAADCLVHLIFRSSEQIRLLKPGYNICCFAWEFEVLKDDTGPGEHPFLNQRRMLSICDEIWVPCHYTSEVLTRHGIGNVHVIPAPIAGPTAPRLDRYDALAAVGHLGVMPLITNFLLSRQDNARACAARSQALMDWLAPRLTAARDPLVYLAVLNPEDFRKNLDALLRGFHYFQQAHKGVCLVVKVLTAADRYSLDQIISDVIPNKLASGSVFHTENIVFLNRYLSDEEMTGLYCLADFYVCASVAEGQNLPLLEAMAHGTVPVSTSNTAMADYITADNAFQIAERVAPNTSEHMAGTIAGKPFNIHTNGSRDVFAALVASRAATPARRRKMSAACAATVQAQFTPDAVWPRIAQRLAAIARRSAQFASRAN